MKAFLKSKNWRVAALVCLAALAVTVSGAFAWYTISKRADASVQVVTSEKGPAIVCGQYTVYVKTKDENGPVYHVYNALDEKVMLKEFDSVFGKSVDTAIIMKIPVSGTSLDGSTNLLLTLSRANRGALADYSDDNGLFSTGSNPDAKVEKDKILRYLTNIASFRFSLIEELNDGNPTPEQIYEKAKGVFAALPQSEKKTFASWNRTEHKVDGKTGQLTWTIPGDDIRDAVSSDNVLNLYIEIDYDKTLINAYLQNHRTNFVARKLGVTDLLEFVGDLVKAEIALPS